MEKSAGAGGKGPLAAGLCLEAGAERTWGGSSGRGRGGSGTKLGILWLVLLVVSSIAAFAAPPIVWVAPSMARVTPDAAAGIATQINLFAAKGEYESFQIIVKAPTGGLTNVNVVAPNLGGPQGTLYREHYIYLTRGTTDWSSNRNKPLGAGWYPDGLIPFKDPATGSDLTGATLDAVPFNLAEGKNQPIWVDVYVPGSQAAGQYQGTFTVTSSQGQTAVTLNLTVWNFTLPTQPALESSILYWTVRGDLQPEQELLRNRLMSTSVNSSDASGLMAQGLSATNLGFWSGADGSNCTTSNPPPSASAVAARAAAYPSDLHLYAYTADEISHCSGLLPTMQQYAQALHAAGVDQLITMPPRSDWIGVVDIWVELPKQYVASDVQAAISRGESVWSYNCLVQDDYSPKWHLDFAPINYRIQPGFINQALGMTGLLYWRADYWTSDPWNDVSGYSASHSAEGLLVYPAAQVGLQGVMPSMRLKWLRDGVDDYDYIELLKKQGQSAWALGVARTIGPDWSNWTRDTNALEAARVQLGEKLNSLAAGPHSLSVTAAASPTTVASGGGATLSATASDSSGHGVATWSWSDGGAGGAFSPSASAQNPSYQAAANTTGSNRTVSLTVTATCDAGSPVSGSATATLTVQSVAHSLTVGASASPTTVASGGTATMTGTASDSLGHSIASWAWSDGGAGGVVSPSAAVQNPGYTAAPNPTDSNRTVTLTLTATCSGPTPLARSASTSISVSPVAHVLSVSASATPATVGSGGTVSLGASASDSRGHSVASWVWSDGGAGGSFAPSANAQNSNYTAPANTTEANRTIALSVRATCSGPTPLAQSASTSIAVTPSAHVLTVSASAAPPSVETGGTTSLTATAIDSLGHGIAQWNWSDGGAGGSFSPSATGQSPSYTAPQNLNDADQMVTLTVTATCGGITPQSASAGTTLTVRPAQTALTVEASPPTPAIVESEGEVQLAATAGDPAVDDAASWAWTDNGANGSFEPSARERAPKYRAPRNTTGKQVQIVLTVTASLAQPIPVSASDTTTLQVEAAQHELAVAATVMPGSVGWRGKASLSASTQDSFGHAIAAWRWSDSGAGGTFRPSASAQNPTWAAENATGQDIVVLLTVTGTCEGPAPQSASGFALLRVVAKPNLKGRGSEGAGPSPVDTVYVSPVEPGPDGSGYLDVPDGYWALAAIAACREAGLAGGYPDGLYRPELPVTRDQAAVYLARALAGGDDMVPAGPTSASFTDVPADHWAFRYVEYVRARGVVEGYPGGSYQPERRVTRAEMAVFIARSVVEPSGEAGLEGYEAPAVPTFQDVRPASWAYRHIEYLAARGFIDGFADGLYRPAEVCTRAQAAVYLARAFELM